jgi:hypothetical protein
MAVAELDKDLADELKVAKKKPRNFAIIAKGPNVLKLLVSKKPIRPAEVMEAKKEVQGNAVVKGVVRGDGSELVFQVIEKPSVDEAKLKKFITETTRLTLKPRFEAVSQLQEVDDDAADDALAADAPAGGGDASEAAAPEAPPPPPPGPSADQLIATLNKLSPAIKQAVADHPDRKAEILKPVAAFQAHVKAGELPQAKEALLEVGALLKTLKAQSVGAPTPPKPATEEELSGTVPPAPSPAGEIPSAPASPQAQHGESEQPESEQEEKSDAEAKAEKFKQDWAAARKNLRLALDKVEEQLAALADALLKSEDPNMLWVAENGLTQILSGLRASAMTIDKTASKTPAKTAAFAKPAIAELEKQLATERVKVCDQNKFGAKVSIKKTIEGALEELMKTLESVD